MDCFECWVGVESRVEDNLTEVAMVDVAGAVRKRVEACDGIAEGIVSGACRLNECVGVGGIDPIPA